MDHEFSVQAMVRGYHIYQSIWDAACDGELLNCERQLGNPHDPSAVAVKKGSTVVGHVPRVISTICSIFIRRGGTIVCRVNGSRRYSSDLPQGGLEVSCVLIFKTMQAAETEKTKRLIEGSLSSGITIAYTPLVSSAVSPETPPAGETSNTSETSTSGDPDNPDIHIVTDDNNDINGDDGKPSVKRLRLSDLEIENIVMGVELSDVHINLAQRILKQQFPELNGLESTLFQEKEQVLTEDNVKNKIHIIHCEKRHHWIVASTANITGGTTDVVMVMDSFYYTIDQDTKQIIYNLFRYGPKQPTIKLIRTQKQEGSIDCGVFAVAMATAIAFDRNPTKQVFQQKLMRAHFVNCLNKKRFTLFP